MKNINYEKKSRKLSINGPTNGVFRIKPIEKELYVPYLFSQTPIYCPCNNQFYK